MSNLPSEPGTPGPSIEQMGGTATLERTQEQHAPGDGERFAHYVRDERIVEAAVTGKPVVALCGKVWIPTKNPDGFPVCPVCKEIYQKLQSGAGGWPFNGGSGNGR